MTFNEELVELVNGDLEVVVKVIEVPVEPKTRTYHGGARGRVHASERILSPAKPPESSGGAAFLTLFV